MNNKLYEYMRLGAKADEARYHEELFDTQKLGKVTDEDIAAYNESIGSAQDYEDVEYSYEEREKIKPSEDLIERIAKKHAGRQGKKIKEIRPNSASSNDIYEEPEYRPRKPISHFNNSINVYKSEEPSESSTNSFVENTSKGDEEDKEFYHYRSRYSKASKYSSDESNDVDYNNISGKTQLVGVMSGDADSSLYPWLHREIAVNQSGFDYLAVAFPTEEEKIADTLKAAALLNIKGFNIEWPFNDKVIPKLKAIGKSAFLIGAVNTLVLKEDGYYGFNTTINAVKRTLARDNSSLEDRNIVILGSGYDANALTIAAAESGARSVLIITDNLEAEDVFIKRISAVYSDTLIKTVAITDDYYDEMNQLTTIKNFKWIAFKAGDFELDEEDIYERFDLGYDMSTDSLSTDFVTKINEADGKACNGLMIKIYKAICSYELWSGEAVSDKLAEKIYFRLRKKLYR